MEVVDLIEHGCFFRHPCAQLVWSITKLLAEDWEVKLCHTYKENNRVVDSLAKAALRGKMVINSLLTEPPNHCSGLL